MTNVAPISPTYLRDRAQQCVRLARRCRDQTTSRELEALSQDLMEKAAEVDAVLAEMAAPIQNKLGM